MKPSERIKEIKDVHVGDLERQVRRASTDAQLTPKGIARIYAELWAISSFLDEQFEREQAYRNVKPSKRLQPGQTVRFDEDGSETVINPNASEDMQQVQR